MIRRRFPVNEMLITVCVVTGICCGGAERARSAVVAGFSASPQPSTTWGRQARTRTRTSSTSRVSEFSSSSRQRRRRHPCWLDASGGFGRRGKIDVAAATDSPCCALGGGNVATRPPSRPSAHRRGARVSTTLAARPPTAEEMDAEWDQILASDDDSEDEEDEDEDEDGEEDEHSDAAMALTDEELLATDASEGGLLEEEAVGKESGIGGRKKRVWYDSYKARMKAEKAKEAAWQEKRRTFSKAHNDYLDEAQRNREIAAARREKYTKKFFRKKKIYDIMKESGRKAVREATWATRWPRKVTRNLEDLKEGEWVEGKVRNVESYGAWVDVNAERDGLLHVKDMGETFTPTAGEVVATKDIILVRIKFVDATTGKLGLSLVEDGPREGDLPLPPPRPQISVRDVSRGAELWGYVERVTNMGAYVNVGAEVPGFLLLKEIPGRPKGLSAPEVLRRHKRLRVYAREVDREGLRIKLTCKRPLSLPRCGPSSALASDEHADEFHYDDTRARYTDGDGWNRDDYGDGIAEEDEEFDEFDDDDDDDDDDEGEDWFFPDRTQFIPAPAEAEAAAQVDG